MAKQWKCPNSVRGSTPERPRQRASKDTRATNEKAASQLQVSNYLLKGVKLHAFHRLPGDADQTFITGNTFSPARRGAG
jgi:hypothetical protein